MTEEQGPANPTATIARNTAIISFVVLVFVVGVAVIWLASTAIMAFAVGIVLAVVLDSGARGLDRILPWGRTARLSLVILLAALVIGAAFWWGGAILLDQLNGFVSSVKSLVEEVQNLLETSDFIPNGTGLASLLPQAGTILGGATAVLPMAFSGLSIAVAIVFIGPFLAWEPPVYKSVVLSLIPRDRRERTNAVLDEASDAMRQWLLGQSISMLVIFVFSLVTLIAIGMPYAVLLSVQAGLLTFIPTLGPFVAGVVIVLAGLSQSTTMAVYGLITYLVIQFLESNLITPVVQERTVHMPPAATLGLQLVAGLLFGFLGLAFIVPLAAASKVLIQELYVNDCLGGGWEIEKKRSGRPGWISRAVDRILGR